VQYSGFAYHLTAPQRNVKVGARLGVRSILTTSAAPLLRPMAGEHARWTRLCQSTAVQAGTQCAQTQQSLDNDGGARDWPGRGREVWLGQSPHRPCGGLVARSRGPLASGTRSRLAQSWPTRRYSC